MTDPDLPCPHLHFDANADVARILADEHNPMPVAYVCELRVRCADCQEGFRFNGVPAGLNYHQPTCAVDELVLHAPIRPASADPDFGIGLPGFSIRAWDGPEITRFTGSAGE